MRIWASVSALLIGVFAGICLIAFVLAGDIYEYQDTFDGAKLPTVDVIVCLAGGRGRITAATDLWYRYWEKKNSIPIVYVSGVGKNSNWNGFTRSIRRGVKDVISPSDVILEKESENTVQNAEVFARFALERKWTRALLVTSPYHMKRSQHLFQTILKEKGVATTLETLSVMQEPFDAVEWRSSFQSIRVTLEEYLKWIYYRVLWKH